MMVPDTDAEAGAETETGVEEADAEHEVITPYDKRWPALIRGRMRQLSEVLQIRNGMEAHGELEGLLEAFRREVVLPDEVRRTTLRDTVLALLVQNRSYQICRRKLFCPVDNCEKQTKNIGRLMAYIQQEHNATE
jgi:hypothetical protein